MKALPGAILFSCLVMDFGAAFAQQVPVPLDTVRVDVISRASPLVGVESRAMEVIDVEMIRSLPASSISELLTWALGVDLMSRSTALADVAVRGSSYEQVLVLVDGVRFRDAQTGHFNLNLAVPLDQVERVEILRGSASSLYGSDALGGVINIVTRRDRSGLIASFSRGSFATMDGSFSLSHPIGAVVADIAVAHQATDGHRSGTDANIDQMRGTLSVLVGTDPLVTEVAFAARDFGAAGFYGDYPAFEKTRTTTASARWRVRLDSTVRIDPIIHYRHGSDDFVLYRDEPDRYRNLHETDQIGGEVVTRFGIGSGAFAWGIHGTRDAIRSASLGDRTEWTAGTSIEFGHDLTTGIAMTGGLRADRLATGDVTFSPSLSTVWRAGRRLRVRSSAGQAFRAPTWTERYYRDPANIGNPDLTAERAWTVDLGVDLHGPSATRASFTTYQRHARDLIDWARPLNEVSGVYETRNVDRATFRGLEMEIAADSVGGFGIVVKGDWLSLSTSVADGFESKYALRPIAESLSLNVDRRMEHLTGGVRLSHRRRTGEASHILADARLAFEFSEFTIRVDGRNLSNTEYRDITFNPAPGRSLTIGVDWRRESGAMR